jgi:hypothetical protein
MGKWEDAVERENSTAYNEAESLGFFGGFLLLEGFFNDGFLFNEGESLGFF